MGVKVRVEEGKVREFRDGFPRNGSARVPIPTAGADRKDLTADKLADPNQQPLRALDQVPLRERLSARTKRTDRVGKELDLSQIAKKSKRQHCRDTCPKSEVEDFRFLFLPAYDHFGDIPSQAERPHREHAVPQRQKDVVSCCRDDTEQFHWHANQNLPVIVVVDIPARVPGVVRRKHGAFDDRVQV